MGFDRKRFMTTRFQAREVDVPVPALAEWFGEGADPAWKVRGLSGQELGRAKEAAARNRSIAAIVEGLASGADREKTAAMRQLLGIDETPQDIAQRIHMLEIGSVDPTCDTELALKVCEVYPVEFYTLTNKITELTGRGHEPGKSTPSGATGK